MASILDQVTMAQRVSQPGTEEQRQAPPSIDQLVNAAQGFLLRTIPDALQAAVTKLAMIDSEKGHWEAEALVQLPNATVKALGLPTQRPVIDTQAYLLRLDAHLNIIAYGLSDSVDA